MSRSPRTLKIDGVPDIELADRVGRVRVSDTTAVPKTFRATIKLLEPEQVSIEMLVWMAQPGNRPVVTSLALYGRPEAPITTTLLRGVLVDQLLRAAIDAATVPVTPRPDAHPRAYEVDGGIWVDAAVRPVGRGHKTPEALIVEAARIYGEAVASGNRAPGKAVADALKVSRPQAARYIRQAREEKLLPPLQATNSEDGTA